MIHNLGGEVPLAFVVLTTDAKNRAEKSTNAAEEIKKSIIKVREKKIASVKFSPHRLSSRFDLQHVADNKVHYKHLAGGVEFVSAIPTSPSGKLLRRVLRDRAKELVTKKVRGKL